METERFKLSDILNGFIIPLILVLIIFVLAVYVNPTGAYKVLGEAGTLGTIAVILTQGFAQMIVLGIPLVLGLTWNKWAGGAAGFIMGGIYYLTCAGTYTSKYLGYAITNGYPTYNFFGDISMFFWIVHGVIIGYMAGALSGGSTNFIRTLSAGLTAAITVKTLDVFLGYTVALEPSRQMAITGMAENAALFLFQAYLPAILLGIIVPILAKVMSWYGLSARRQY